VRVNSICNAAFVAATWANTRATSLAWQSAASSADGLRLVAVTNGGQIWTSVNGGTVWTARGAALSWYAAASSSDGTRLVAVVNGGQIWTSTDIGVTWTARESARSWQSGWWRHTIRSSAAASRRLSASGKLDCSS
jgi:hypothetical protein